MRVAIVGGTGPFGKALAARLHEAGVDVVVGSRDAERARAAALELDCVGETNGDACADADFVILAVNADAALDTARELRGANRTRSPCSRSRRSCVSRGRPCFRLPMRSRSRSRSRRSSTGQSSPGSTRSPPRASAARSRPTRMHSSVATTPMRRRRASSSPRSSRTGRALDAGPLASARALEGLTAVIVNMNRRYKGHAGIRVTGLD